MQHRIERRSFAGVLAALALFASACSSPAVCSADGGGAPGVGPQYDTTHVYVGAGDLDPLVASLIATFGGHPAAKITTNVLPTPSTTQFQAVLTPAGNLSVFTYQTPIPYPFGTERTGCLVRDMDQAISAARKCGAAIIVAPFPDPIGRDAVIEWPGGLRMQLYWHTKASTNDPLQTVPENRVYLSPEKADEFVRDFVAFSKGRVVLDNRQADAGEVGEPGMTMRRLTIESAFGKMIVFATDGHLPYPYGYDDTGYEVGSLTDTLAKASAAGAVLLVAPHAASGRTSAVVEFPGGYIAELHSALPPS